MTSTDAVHVSGVDRCGNVASILELDENLNSTYQTFEAAAQVRFSLALTSFLSKLIVNWRVCTARLQRDSSEEYKFTIFPLISLALVSSLSLCVPLSLSDVNMAHSLVLMKLTNIRFCTICFCFVNLVAICFPSLSLTKLGCYALLQDSTRPYFRPDLSRSRGDSLTLHLHLWIRFFPSFLLSLFHHSHYSTPLSEDGSTHHG